MMTKKTLRTLRYSSSLRRSTRLQDCLLCVIFSLIILLTLTYPTLANYPQNPQTLVEQAKELYQSGQFPQAIPFLQQAADTFAAKSDKLGQAIALTNLSLTYKQLGQLQKAETAINQSLNLLQNSPLLAETLEIKGSLQLELGQPEQALDTWKQSANTYARDNNQLGKIRSLINQSLAQQALGLYRQSRNTLENINQSLAKQPDSIVKATALRSLGDVLQLSGEFERSLEILQQSWSIANKLKSPPEASAALLSLGNITLALANQENSQADNTHTLQSKPLSCINKPLEAEAVNFYQQAAKFYAEAANTATSPLTQITAQVNQVSALSKLQKWSDIEKISDDIQQKLNKISPSQPAIYAQIHFSQNLECWKQTTNTDKLTWQEIAKGFASANQQAKIINDKRSEAYSLGVLGGLYLENKDLANAEKLTEQALIIAQNIKADDITYLWQWQLGHILTLEGNISNAITSYTEAVNTLKTLRNDLIALNPNIQFSFRDNVEPVYRQLVDLLLSKTTTPPPQQNLKQARATIETLQLAELENFFREACLQAAPEQIDEVVDKVDTTAAIIYPIILQDRLEIILKLPKQSELHHYTIAQKASNFEKILDKLQKNLREPDKTNEVKKISQQVYSWLIQPLESELTKNKIKTLVFVLDGSLRNIPMAILYDNQQKQYLIQKYALALAPGLQLINPKPLQRKGLNALIGGISEKRQIGKRSFPPLKNVTTELQTITSVLPQSAKLINNTFTKKNVQNQIEKQPYTVVHLATHGEFSSNPEKTFILAWEQLLKVKDFDNLIRIGNKRDSNPIELLVLSACETALGDRRATLGLAGIAVRAGVRSTLATLWSVDDESTAQFMSYFYQELENTRLTKAEALRRAQLKMLSNDEITYLWAPYVLFGNWL